MSLALAGDQANDGFAGLPQVITTGQVQRLQRRVCAETATMLGPEQP